MHFRGPGMIIFALLSGSCQPETGQLYTRMDAFPHPPPLALTSDLEVQLIQLGMVDINKLHPFIQVELKYSGTDNLLQTDMYGTLDKAYLHPDAADKLLLAAQLLEKQHSGLRLLVYDAARPLSVQKWMWEQVDLPFSEKIRFLNPPEKTSLHNYGAAVDITLTDKEGNALDMGTPYDDPSALAYPVRENEFLRNGQLSEEVVSNRQLLRHTMLEAGFTGIDSEWWHFNSCSREYAAGNYRLIE